MENSFRCMCTCSIITIDHYKEDDYEDMFITLYERVHKPNENIWDRIKRFFKRLVGRDYLIGEVGMNREEFEKFKEIINKI